MRKKIITTAILTGATALSLGAASAWAGTPTTALCPIAGCTDIHAHLHDGTAYLGHYAGDGHDHDQSCLTTSAQHSESDHHASGHGHHNKHC